MKWQVSQSFRCFQPSTIPCSSTSAFLVWCSTLSIPPTPVSSLLSNQPLTGYFDSASQRLKWHISQSFCCFYPSTIPCSSMSAFLVWDSTLFIPPTPHPHLLSSHPFQSCPSQGDLILNLRGWSDRSANLFAAFIPARSRVHPCQHSWFETALFLYPPPPTPTSCLPIPFKAAPHRVTYLKFSEGEVTGQPIILLLSAQHDPMFIHVSIPGLTQHEVIRAGPAQFGYDLRDNSPVSDVCWCAYIHEYCVACLSFYLSCFHAHTHTYTHACTHMHTHARTHACTHTHAHTCMHTHTNACNHAHNHACTHTRTDTHARAHTYTCMHVHVHTCIPTDRDLHTHAHTLTYWLTHRHTQAHACTHAHKHARTHAHTHTHTHSVKKTNAWIYIKKPWLMSLLRP